MAQSEIGRKMAANLISKISQHEASTQCGRIDLTFTDYNMVDSHSALLMLEYQPGLGIPKRAQVESWVNTTFKNKFRASDTSLRNYPDYNVVTVLVSDIPETMPLDRTASMMRLGAARYMDGSKQTWEVAHNERGERYLARVQPDDIEEILKERVNRRRQGRYAAVSLTDLREASSLAHPEVGDEVIYSDRGHTSAGKVTSVGDDYINVSGGGKIPKGWIVDITHRSPTDTNKMNKDITDFFSKAYGPDFPVDKLKVKK
jgi:hypothetical protein